MSRLLLALLPLVAASCLEPQVGDDVPPRGLVLPAGTVVESIYDYPEMAEQVADNDGVDNVIPMLSGFAGGQPMRFWDFGEAPQNAAPIFALYRGDLMGEWSFASDINIIDSIPGDDNYTPFWSIFLFEVTDDYQDEVIPSFAAIEEAIELGLLKPEPTQIEAYSNCPVVHRDVRLMVGLDENGDDDDGGEDGFLAPIPVYYQGKMATYYDFARNPIHHERALEDGINVPISHQFILARPGEPLLSEVRRGVDMTGDGDTRDTNNIFPDSLAEDSYTPLRHSWRVTVPATYNSIDSSQDELVADFAGFTDLFTADDPLVAKDGNVLAYEDDGPALHNMPMQSERGGL